MTGRTHFGCAEDGICVIILLIIDEIEVLNAMILKILGCNGPYPAPGAACSGYLLTSDSGNTRILIDCGPGVLAQLMAEGGPDSLDAVLLSHLHIEQSIVKVHCSVTVSDLRGTKPGSDRVLDTIQLSANGSVIEPSIGIGIDTCLAIEEPGESTIATKATAETIIPAATHKSEQEQNDDPRPVAVTKATETAISTAIHRRDRHYHSGVFIRNCHCKTLPFKNFYCTPAGNVLL